MVKIVCDCQLLLSYRLSGLRKEDLAGTAYPEQIGVKARPFKLADTYSQPG